jgi:integrase
MGRRGFREDAIYFDHSGDCRDTRHHKGCPGRWRGAVSLGYSPDGKRVRRKVSGLTKQEVKDKLTELHSDIQAGIQRPAGRYTVSHAVEDWLREGLDGRAEKTVGVNRDVLQPVVHSVGQVALRELTTRHVRGVLTEIAATHSSRTVVLTHNALERAIRHAEANDYIRRNVAALVRPPAGQPGRPSKSLTAQQAGALLAAAEGSRLGAYVVLCLLAGVRTEEARALTWDHVDLSGDQAANPPVPPHVAVWRSVRAHGDTKTQKSLRTLALPERAVEALREHRERQAEQRLLAGEIWQDHGLVFCTATGTLLAAGNVRRTFKKITKVAGLGEDGAWPEQRSRPGPAAVIADTQPQFGLPLGERRRRARPGHQTRFWRPVAVVA